MSHSVATRILDPIFTSKNRAEFRLDSETLYSTDMRLLNVGIAGSAAGKKYNYLLGAEGVIESIQLYDNNTLLSQILEASIYTAFKNLRKDNDTNISKSKQLKHNSLGFLAQGDASYGGTDLPGEDSITVKIQQEGLTANEVGSLAHISLRDCLPFLNAQNTVPTNVFKRLRLVINYKNSEELKQLQSDNTQTGLSAEQGTRLVVDEITGRGSPEDMKARNDMMMGYKGASWNEVEHDRVYIAGTGSTDGVNPQEGTFLVTGYNDKSLRRLLLVSTPINQALWQNGGDNKGVAGQGSVASWNSEVQVRVNGQNKFIGSGWQGANRRAGHLADTYGSLNTIVGANTVGFGQNERVASGGAVDFIGQLDYTGLRVDERVQELKITFSRNGIQGSGAGNVATQTPLHLNMFGEVDKAVIMTGKEEYEVVYA
jgi:hypothetical protein